MDLYTKFAHDFSKTRRSQWKGWERITNNINSHQLILDVGCGNGRFLNFLISKNLNPSLYVGIDYSVPLLNEAKAIPFKNSLFSNVDLREKWEIGMKDFDLVVCFGVLHHLLDEQHRKYLFQKISTITKKSGLFIFTIWKFIDDNRERRKIVSKLERKNNYIMKFSNIALRECHDVQEDEIYGYFREFNLEVVEEFYADGKSNRLNKYFVVKNKNVYDPKADKRHNQ
ncbi:class I SAM-dependent methyltransferase [Candidatus Dojkabacteria bacterium]|uniref:Class I SAM-dependent methyltransferase n=1 Tax=Candidatus Dojkabacteria bacterium TaxID=2099670 RepID=A0A3M0Z0D7_9BACT|nr:MAG: class I SAM-dependent methyltransferase [Candidatus Dojkabacteria bacterium]